MSTTYTPNPANAPATITLPSDLDDASAESVNSPFRAIADNLMGLAALKAASNVFTAGPQIVDITDNEVAMIETSKGSLDDASVGGTNAWKLLGNFKCVGTRGFRIYSGGVDATGLMAIVVNAHWHKSDSKWRQDDAANDSYAFWLNGSFYFSRKNAGAAAWSAWPTTATGEVVIANSLTVADIFALNTVHATQSMFAGADFKYSPAKPRTKILATSTATVATLNGGNGDLLADGTRDFIWVPFCFPEGSEVYNIEIVHTQASATPSEFTLYQRIVDWTAVAGASQTAVTPTAVSGGAVVGSSMVAVGSAIRQLTVFTVSGHVFNSDYEYQLKWHPGSGTDSVQGMRAVNWQDHGPANI